MKSTKTLRGGLNFEWRILTSRDYRRSIIAAGAAIVISEKYSFPKNKIFV
jgi:hypothetical protein